MKLGAFNYITENPWKGIVGLDGNPLYDRVQIGEIAFKNRDTHEFSTGILEKIGDVFRITSDQKIQGIAPGQFGVIYDKNQDLCYGSGVII